MDEQQAHDAIEQIAETYVATGWEPTDAEPGEWLELTHTQTGQVIYINADGEIEGEI